MPARGAIRLHARGLQLRDHRVHYQGVRIRRDLLADVDHRGLAVGHLGGHTQRGSEAGVPFVSEGHALGGRLVLVAGVEDLAVHLRGNHLTLGPVVTRRFPRVLSDGKPLGLGNDIGGSLRNPAHCCGIASIKPSTGVIPSAGVLPPEEQSISFQLMAVQGVMARHVADVLAALRRSSTSDATE